MPKKKAKAPTERHATAIRLNDAEYAPVRADLQKINATGVPASFGQYAKHATQSYARLRKLEARIMMDAGIGDPPSSDPVVNYARSLVEWLR